MPGNAADRTRGTPTGSPRTPSPSSSQEHILPSVEFTFSCSPSSAGCTTPASSVNDNANAFSPGADRHTLTPSMQTRFQALHLKESVQPTPTVEDPQADYTDRARRVFGLSPTPKTPEASGATTTYRDLYNVTPSPAGPSPRRPSHQQHQHRSDTPSSPLGNVISEIQNINLGDSRGEPNNAPEHEGDDSHTATDVSTHDSETDASEDDDDHSDDERFFNIRQEELPQAPIYNPRLQNALRDIRGQLSSLAEHLEKRRALVQDTTTALHGLHQQTLAASRFAYPATRTVGFIGDSGMGKSSLINSILDQEGLARSSGDGAACTTVVTEFRSVDEAHPQNYTVEADFMNDVEIRELLEELLSSVRKYYTGAFREVQTAAEQEDIKAAALRAWETLRSLFPTHEDCDLEFLSQEGENAAETIMNTLHEWAMAGLDHRPGGRDNLRYSIVARHADECMERLDGLMADPKERDRPALWPFVKLVRVYLRSPVLRTGLVLADLPGFRDLNYARVRATERYLRHNCEEVFIVSSILRCTTDQSIGDIIRRCARDQPIRLVCTRSEDVDARETARTASAEDRTRIRDMDEKIQALEREIRSTRSRRRQARGNKIQSLAVEEADLSDQKEALEFRLKRYLIKRRNTRVTGLLLTAWGDRARVFCVSNKLYSDHRLKTPEEDNGYLKLSGIKKLRQYCQLVPADAQFRATASFLKNEVPALLGSLTQWALAGSNALTVARAEILSGALHKAEETLEQSFLSDYTEISLAHDALKLGFDSEIAQRISRSRNIWRDGAVHASEDWAGWHHMSYAAWCRNYGTHYTKTQQHRCWNEEILGSAREQLALSWDNLFEDMNLLRESLGEKISDRFERVRESIQVHQDLAPDTLRNLLLNIERRRICIDEALFNAFKDLMYTTEKIKDDTIAGHSSSFIAGVMRPIYNICREQYGTGSDSRRKGTMYRHLSSPTLFMDLGSIITEQFEGVLQHTFNVLDRKIRDNIGNVTRDLRSSITVEGEISEAGQDPQHTEELRGKLEQLRGILASAQVTVRDLRQG